MLATLNGNRLSRLFDTFEPLVDNWNWNPVSNFGIDVEETESAYILTADLPGVKKEDLDISVQDNQVSISYERKEEKKRILFAERKFGKFSRSIRLPDTSGEITASLNEGVLTLKVEKSEKLRPKRIEVK